MFEKAEQEYQDLKHRKSIIENDKDKIEKVISELDLKKNETLKKTWVKVNRDFGSIFSTLLPGANAKLEPEEGKSVSDCHNVMRCACEARAVSRAPGTTSGCRCSPALAFKHRCWMVFVCASPWAKCGRRASRS